MEDINVNVRVEGCEIASAMLDGLKHSVSETRDIIRSLIVDLDRLNERLSSFGNGKDGCKVKIDVCNELSKALKKGR